MDLKVSLKNSIREITVSLPCEPCFLYPRYVTNTINKDVKDCKNFKKCFQGALAKTGNHYPFKNLLIRRA